MGLSQLVAHVRDDGCLCFFPCVQYMFMYPSLPPSRAAHFACFFLLLLVHHLSPFLLLSPPPPVHHLLPHPLLLHSPLPPSFSTTLQGLALINGTQLITSLGADALHRASLAALQADVIAALSVDVLNGTPRAFDQGEHCRVKKKFSA